MCNVFYLHTAADFPPSLGYVKMSPSEIYEDEMLDYAYDRLIELCPGLNNLLTNLSFQFDETNDCTVLRITTISN